MKFIEKLKPLNKYSAAVSFLSLEVFAILAFSFSGSYVLFGSLSLAVCLLLLLFNIGEIKATGLSTIGFFIIPVFLYTLLTALGIYSRGHALLGNFSVAEVVFIPLGLLPMAFSGYLLSLDKSFKLQTFLLVVYGALTAITVVNMIVNLVNFGAFYTVIYSDYSMYYNGQLSDTLVKDMAYTLEGFKLIEVKMSHYVLYPGLLFSSIAMIPYLKFKEAKKTFIAYCGFAFIGLLAIVLFPSVIGAFAIGFNLLIAGIVLLCKKVEKARKPVKIGVTIIGVLGILFFFMMFINQQVNPPLFTGVKFFDKLFNTNRIARIYNPMVNNLFSDKFLGFIYYFPFAGSDPFLYDLTGSFFFDNFMTSGVIGNIAFVMMMVLAIFGFKRYFLSKNSEFSIKSALFTLVSFYFGYSFLFSDGQYGIFYDIRKPIFLTSTFMIVLFICAYVYSANPKEVKKEEKENEVKA